MSWTAIQGCSHLYEFRWSIRGYASLISIGQECFERWVAGGAGMPATPTAAEILIGGEHAVAGWDGVWIWIERFVRDSIAHRELAVHLWRTLGRMHLKGVLVTADAEAGRPAGGWG